jgi:DUF2934 family protein
MFRQTQEITRNGPAESTNFHPEPDQIEALAYQHWLNRGCPIGTADEDWLKAEEELRSLTVPVRRAA